MHNIEVQKKSEPPVAEAQIGKKLSAMDRQYAFYSFDFHNDSVFYQNIEPESILKFDLAIDDWQIDLLIHMQS